MASQADIDAIVQQGGITVDQFPPLESDLNYIINDFLTVDYDLIQEVTFDFASVSQTAVDIALTEDVTFSITHDATVDNSLALTLDTLFSVDSVSLVETLIELDQDVQFSIAHAVSAQISIEISQDDVFEIEHESLMFALEPGFLDSDTTFSVSHESEVRNTTYVWGNVLDIPVWSWAPNWSSDVTETLQWLTDVLASPSGAEQRRTLRVYPRRQFEFTIAAKRAERSYLDQFLTTHSASDLYLPTWHESHLLDADVAAGAVLLPCSTASAGEFREGDIIMIAGETVFDYELSEVSAITSAGLVLNFGLTNSWPQDSFIYPVRKSMFTDQPTLSRVTDTVATSQVRFQVTEVNNDVLAGSSSGILSTPFLPDAYRGYSVLAAPPDQGDSLDFDFIRLIETADNQTGFPIQRDTAGIAFTSQKHAWTTAGRDENRALRSLLFNLRGRAAALWIPTFFSDFEIVADTDAGDSFLIVENVRFGALGGPREGRQDIVIEMFDGSRLYRRIVSNTIDTQGNEIIGVDSAFPNGINAADVLRISFMQLSRLDQDSVDIVHKTDSAGASTCNLTFRSAPELRVPAGGF